MMSFKRVFDAKKLIDPFDLEPYQDQYRALKRIQSFGYKPKMIGKQKTYQLTEKDIDKMNKDAYKVFTKRLEVLNKKKTSYETGR